MSEMSVGTPGDEARVTGTVTTTSRRAGKTRGRAGSKKGAGTLGECVTDQVRWDRYMRSRKSIIFCDEAVGDFSIKEMANMIARPLEYGGLGAEDRTREVRSHAQRLAEDQPLARIVGENNTTKYGAAGRPRQRSCFICRRYRETSQNTCWMCRHCGMPLCKKDRKRPETCLEEHQCSDNPFLGCGMMARGKGKWKMPPELKVFNRTRSRGWKKV